MRNDKQMLEEASILLRIAKELLGRNREAMDVTMGEEGLSKTWQAPFPAEVMCLRCGGTARIAFVAHEGLDGEKPDKMVWQIHPNEGADGGSYWLHDRASFAVYLCRDCLEPMAEYNQA